MHLELILLVLESVLLVFTVILLVMSLKEGRSRDALIMEVSRATRILTRHEYFITVTDAMMDSREEVFASITGRMPHTEDDKKRTADVMNKIQQLTARGVRVMYTIPKFQDRLHIGWLYSKAGAQVYYSACPFVHDFRYTVVDRAAVVIGVPEGHDQKEPTKAGYKIPSEGLAHILNDHFASCRQENMMFADFLKETIRHTGVPPEALAKELRIEASELKKYFEG